jgi:hypothetical protein
MDWVWLLDAQIPVQTSSECNRVKVPTRPPTVFHLAKRDITGPMKYPANAATGMTVVQAGLSFEDWQRADGTVATLSSQGLLSKGLDLSGLKLHEAKAKSARWV